MNWKEFIKRVDWRALLKPLAILVAIVLIFVGGEVVGAARNSNPLAHIDYNLWVAIVIALVALAGLSIQLLPATLGPTRLCPSCPTGKADTAPAR